MQKITIQQFCLIEQVSLEIKDFILLIGPQVTGKSTIAKLIYFFKELPQNWRNHAAKTLPCFGRL